MIVRPDGKGGLSSSSYCGLGGNAVLASTSSRPQRLEDLDVPDPQLDLFQTGGGRHQRA
ncbi:MAG: hypothetical protein M5T61_18670 [Acidimicrobiia bacterium]|nr:hypothetical protein [Acidimicrobiia bacterium]